MDDQKIQIEFTHINIKKIVKNRAYVAEFTLKYFEICKDIQVSIHGKSADECISKTEEFLQLKLTEADYTKPNN
jgi:hypothetical protein